MPALKATVIKGACTKLQCLFFQLNLLPPYSLCLQGDKSLIATNDEGDEEEDANPLPNEEEMEEFSKDTAEIKDETISQAMKLNQTPTPGNSKEIVSNPNLKQNKGAMNEKEKSEPKIQSPLHIMFSLIIIKVLKPKITDE